MYKMRLVSQYTHYGNEKLWDSSSPIKCVCDEQLWANKRENKQVLLLIEPRSIQPNVYDHVLEVYDQYEYVFTHDSKLLKCLPNAKPIIWGGVWCRCENPEKTKLISMTSSNKELCDLHKERVRIARKYKDKIDVYGTIDEGTFVSPIDTLKDYKYSVVIENYIDSLWFTEKLLNCFATKTIPIYYGSPDIYKYFNIRGMVICKNIEELENTINRMIEEPKFAEEFYELPQVQEAMNDNYKESKKYEKFDEWLYKTYDREIGELFE